MTEPVTHKHESVLLAATVNALINDDFSVKSADAHADLPPANKPGVYVDGTFGRGGHSRYLLRHLSPDARLFVFDKDPQAIAAAQELAAQDSRVIVVHDSFANLAEVLAQHHVSSLQGVMLDLGVSSPQLDDASRGFSFMKDGPLDMRMDTTRGQTAAQWLETATVDELKGVIKDYGEERHAFQIAKAIDHRRKSQPLRTTLELAELVAGTVGRREKGHHPATRTFQAIRIHLNEELSALSGALTSVLNLLDIKGRMAVISFHSLEDRIVKQLINRGSKLDPALARLPLREDQLPKPMLRDLGKLKPASEEVDYNVRSRSATLRVAEKLRSQDQEQPSW